MRRGVGAVAVALVVAACAGPASLPRGAQRPSRVTVTVYVTDPAHLSDGMQVVAPGAGPAAPVIDVDDHVRFQVIDGFGASLTDSSAWLIAASANRDALMSELFDPMNGIGISLLRQPIGGTDYTTRGFYTYDDVEPGDADPTLGRFSIDADREYTIPLLRQALALNPALRIIASPWSPPAWMKSNGDVSDGELDPGAETAYAAYIARFVDAYTSAGVPVYAVTPGTEPVSWMKRTAPHLTMSREQQAELVRDHLAPALAALTPKPRLLVFDDNIASTHPAFAGYAEDLLADPVAGAMIDGAAVHCYFGGLADLTDWHARFPTKDAYVTECSSGIEDGAYDGHMVDALIDGSRNWARGVVLWNVALDEDNGPYVDGCDGRCTPLLTIGSDGSLVRRLDFYALAHFTHFVRPGAWRVASTVVDEINSVAFANADGSAVVVVHNTSSEQRVVTARLRGTTASQALPPGAIATFVSTSDG